MKLSKPTYLGLLGLIAMLTGVLVFSVGWYMGQATYKRMIQAAMDEGEMHDASSLLLQWSQESPKKAAKDPVFFFLCAKVWYKKNDLEKCMYNLNKAFELLREE